MHVNSDAQDAPKGINKAKQRELHLKKKNLNKQEYSKFEPL